MRATTQVLVVGAGPAGLTLACSLARQGVSVRVLEQARAFPSAARGSRGTAYQPRTLEVFDDLGVIDDTLRGTWTGTEFRIYREGKLVVDHASASSGITATPEIPYPHIVRPLPTWQLEGILAARLAELGVELELGRRLVSFEQDETGVRAAVSEVTHDEPAWGHSWSSPQSSTLEVPEVESPTEVIEAEYLVGCDGARGRVRGLAGLSYEFGAEHRFAGMVADVCVDGVEPTYPRMWYGPGGQVVVLSPQPTCGNFQFIAQLSEDEQGRFPEPSLELAQQLFAERAGMPDVVFHDMTWKTFFRVREALADHFRSGRVFIAGDAAHIHSPSGGQGANTGIQDGYNLAWKLGLVTTGRALPHLLDTYEPERRSAAAGVLAVSGGNHEAMHGRGLRHLANRVQLRLRPDTVSRRQQNQMAQLDVAYPDSELNIGTRSAGHPTVGDRAPDGHLVDPATGRRLRLFDVYRGPHFTLLVFDPSPAGVDVAQRVAAEFGDTVLPCVLKSVDDRVPDWPGSVYIDVLDRTREAYRAHQHPLVLVRPDGYLCFHGALHEAEALVHGLRRFLVPHPLRAQLPTSETRAAEVT